MNREYTKLLALAREYEENLPARQPVEGVPGEGLVSSYIDHTLLKPEATHQQVEKLCDEARRYAFASVCVNSVYVPEARRLLDGSPVQVCTVVGFPLGAVLSEARAAETRFAIAAGAREIDMVISIGQLKGGAYDAVAGDIRRVVEIAHADGAIVKVILEMALLTRFEKILGCLISQAEGADFVKTSTGFGPGGATLEDVDLMRRVVSPRMGVKAAGGIRSLVDARAMLDAGATRLGTSAGVKIMQELADLSRSTRVVNPAGKGAQ